MLSNWEKIVNHLPISVDSYLFRYNLNAMGRSDGMNPELRIPAEKCSKRVLLLVLAKVQDENISVDEAFSRLLDGVCEKHQQIEDTLPCTHPRTTYRNNSNQSG